MKEILKDDVIQVLFPTLKAENNTWNNSENYISEINFNLEDSYYIYIT